MAANLSNYPISDMRKDIVALAHDAESAERFDDMTKLMVALVRHVDKEMLTPEERNLLSIAFKNAIGTRRTSIRALDATEAKNPELAKIYRKNIVAEMESVVKEALDLLNSTLIPLAKQAKALEAEIFYYKMIGDYNRYMSEVTGEEVWKKGTLEAYQIAWTMSTKELSEANPVRLGLALNFSVYYYEILEQHDKAVALATQAFEDAVSKLDDIKESDAEAYHDGIQILHLMKDNLRLWTGAQDETDEPTE